MAMRPKSEMSPPPPPSDPRDAVIQELRKGTQLAALLRQQVELIPEPDRRDAALANMDDISRALESSLSILQSSSEREHCSSSDAGGAVAHAALAPACASDGGVGAKKGSVVRTRKVRHRRGRHGEEFPIMEIQTETPANDRFHWRKYGEKKILNAAFPRLYYRCGYGDDHKCPAKKYVQQENNSNPRLFTVTLIGEHTCDALFPADQPSSSSASQVLDFTKASLSSPTATTVGDPRLKKEDEDMYVTMRSYTYDELSFSHQLLSPMQWDLEMQIRSLFPQDSAGSSYLSE